jgi:hypothetical protein
MKVEFGNKAVQVNLVVTPITDFKGYIQKSNIITKSYGSHDTKSNKVCRVNMLNQYANTPPTFLSTQAFSLSTPLPAVSTPLPAVNTTVTDLNTPPKIEKGNKKGNQNKWWTKLIRINPYTNLIKAVN